MQIIWHGEDGALHVQETLSFVDSVEGIGEHQRKHRHELHHNVQSRSTGILEGISN